MTENKWKFRTQIALFLTAFIGAVGALVNAFNLHEQKQIIKEQALVLIYQDSIGTLTRDSLQSLRTAFENYVTINNSGEIHSSLNNGKQAGNNLVESSHEGGIHNSPNHGGIQAGRDVLNSKN